MIYSLRIKDTKEYLGTLWDIEEVKTIEGNRTMFSRNNRAVLIVSNNIEFFKTEVV